MDATLSQPVGSGEAEIVEPAHRELLSLRPHQAHWRAVLTRSAIPSTRRHSPWPAIAALAGVAGAASLAVLAAARPDLGGYEPAALVSALAAACAPIALCLRLAAAVPELGSGDAPLARKQAELDARERLLAEQVTATRHEASEAQPDAKAAGTRPAAATLKMRRHARIRPRHLRTFIATEDGRRLNALIIDVSQSGVAIEGNLPGLWIGSMVTVGSRRAKAVRALPRGMAFEFSMPVPAEALTVDFVL